MTLAQPGGQVSVGPLAPLIGAGERSQSPAGRGGARAQARRESRSSTWLCHGRLELAVVTGRLPRSLERAGAGRRAPACAESRWRRRRLDRGLRLTLTRRRREQRVRRSSCSTSGTSPRRRSARSSRARSTSTKRYVGRCRARSELDGRITEAADEWTADRFGAVERNVLRASHWRSSIAAGSSRGRYRRGRHPGEAVRIRRRWKTRERHSWQDRAGGGGVVMSTEDSLQQGGGAARTAEAARGGSTGWRRRGLPSRDRDPHRAVRDREGGRRRARSCKARAETDARSPDEL